MADEDEQPSSEPEQQNETEAQLAEMRDRMLRALAEAENIRRRAEREKLEVSQYAIARFARDFGGQAVLATFGLPEKFSQF